MNERKDVDGRKERMGGCSEWKERIEGRKEWMGERCAWKERVNGRGRKM